MTRITGFSLLSLAILVTVLWSTATAFDKALERQTTFRTFAEALQVRPDRLHNVTWLAPNRPLTRPFTEADASLLGLALEEAWEILAVAQDSGAATALSDRFSGVALERAALSVSDSTAYGGRMAVLSIEARPEFFHKDGSLFQAETEMTVARYLSEGSELDTFELTRETGIATFLNESNGWRLYSYERRAAEALPGGQASWSGQMTGFNYYPMQTPWRDFWHSIDMQIVEADFSRIRGLGGNSIRIFLTRDDFLANRPDKVLDDLTRLLALAKRHGLSVVPTLFDLKQDYGPGGWARDALYLDRVLPVLAASEAVAFVDIKNEPDLDFTHHGEAKVTAWLRSMAGLIRSDAPDLPLTIGWSKADDAGRLATLLDVITYHDYAPQPDTDARLAAVKVLAGDKPVVVTEIGQSSFELGVGFPGSDAAQAYRLEERLDALREADGVLVWTLNDFEEVDGTVVGASPWTKRLQAAFGVLRTDGSEKLAAQMLRTFWTTAGLSEGTSR